MSNFSRNTFDKLKHYVGVRLQQGVPLVDADWNEMDDIRKHELQTFLKEFVGSGVPKGNDGFSIAPLAGIANDFTIKGGTAEQPGYCLVEGWEAVIDKDINYMQQPLYNNDALAGEWGVEPLKPLSPPSSGEQTRTDTVYLDVWEREVDAQEDGNLINPTIGIETCVRLKREWVVRAAQGANEPPTPPPGHVYYTLALLKHLSDKITVEDRRRTGLAVLSEDITIKDGNVGINTQEPKKELDVNGDINVTGGLSSRGGQVRRDFLTWNTTAANDLPIHIKTNIPRKSCVMYRFLVEGYNYGMSAAICSDAVGYTHAQPDDIVNPQTNNYANGVSISQYYSSDGFLVIKLTTTYAYFIGFSVSAWFTNPAGTAFDISASVIQQTNDL